MRNTAMENHRRTKKAWRLNPRRMNHGRGAGWTPKRPEDLLEEKTKTGRGAGEEQQATDAETPDRHAKDK